MLIIIAILPVFWGSSVELSMPTTISVNVTSPVSWVMALFVVTICLLVILNLGWTLSPDCMIICKHPSGLPVGSLSASVQFKKATVVSRPKIIINIYNVRMFHGYEKKINMISNVQYVSKPIFPFFLSIALLRAFYAITQKHWIIFCISSIFSTTIYKITTYLQVGPPGR